MGQKEKQARGKFIAKHETEEIWDRSNGGAGVAYVPAAGEQVIYDPDNNYPYPRIKCGDGIKKVKELPFISTVTSLATKIEKTNVEVYKNQTQGENIWRIESAYYSSSTDFNCEISNGIDTIIIDSFEPIDEEGLIFEARAELPIYGKWWGEYENNGTAHLRVTMSEVGELIVRETSNDCGVFFVDYCNYLTLTLYNLKSTKDLSPINSITAGKNISLENNGGTLVINGEDGGSNYIAGNGINISNDNTISANLVPVLKEDADETQIPTAPSVRDQLIRKLEGFSTKFTVTKRGWHRVLNTIRGNAGQLYITITDGYTLQSLVIDISGFVQFGTGRTPEEAGYMFCKSNSSYLGPRLMTAQSDPYYKYKITQIRMGYPDEEARSFKFDPEVATGTVINCYVDVYIDYNPTASNDQDAQLLLQFTGKSYQHNCYPITKEITDENYTVQIENDYFTKGESISLTSGMYGETLDFINVPIREDYDIVEDGYKERLVNNFKIKVSENSDKTSSPIEAHNIKDVSAIQFDDAIFGGNQLNFRLFRKYNLLPLFSVSSTNDMFSYYNWANNTTIGSKYQGGNIVLPYKSGKKSTAGVHYNITKSGTIIFSVKDSNSSITSNYLNIYYSNKAESAIILPAGKYITNVYDIYYTDNISSSTKNHIIFNNFVGTGSDPQPKGFILTEPSYLTFARIRIDAAKFAIGSDEIATYTPFLIKVDDSVEMEVSSSGGYDIVDSRFEGFYIRSNLDCSDTRVIFTSANWLELENKDEDRIIINDTFNNEYHEIDHFNEFYSSWRAKGIYGDELPEGNLGVTKIDFNRNKTIVYYAGEAEYIEESIELDNAILNTYNMYVDKSENPYDTLFMFNDLTPINATIRHNEIVDIAEFIQNSGGMDIDSELNSTSTNPVQNKVIVKELGKCLRVAAEGDDKFIEVVPGVRVESWEGAYKPSGDLIIEHDYGTISIMGNKIHMTSTGSENDYLEITMNGAGSDGMYIQSSEAVKQAFKDWLGIE